MPPQVKMYQYQAGGTTEEIDEWNKKVRGLISSSLAEFLKDDYHFKVKFVQPDSLEQGPYASLWADTEVLYEAVAANAYTHTLGHEKLPAKLADFDYTLGTDVRPLAKALDTDAFLFVYGYDYVSTKGRIAVQTFNTMAALALSAALGGGVIYIPQHAPSFLSMGLVDGKTGDLLWFKTIPPDKGENFIKPKKITGIMQWMVKDLNPETGARPAQAR